MNEPYIPPGIDVSKSTFHVALLKSEKQSKYQQFTNDSQGFTKLSQWLGQ